MDIARGALGAAMRCYQRCREALAAGLGVRPSAATEALHQRIRARPAPAGEPGAPPLLAVLPFEGRSPGTVPPYLVLGFAEQVIRALSRFRSLRVIAAQSSFAALESDDPGASRPDPRETGARLGARYLLADTLAKADGCLRIGTELLDAASAHCLWSERYDSAAQDEIARAVASALAVRIDGEQLRGVKQRAATALHHRKIGVQRRGGSKKGQRLGPCCTSRLAPRVRRADQPRPAAHNRSRFLPSTIR
jgi:TolB-like protein